MEAFQAAAANGCEVNDASRFDHEGALDVTRWYRLNSAFRKEAKSSLTMQVVEGPLIHVRACRSHRARLQSTSVVEDLVRPAYPQKSKEDSALSPQRLAS